MNEVRFDSLVIGDEFEWRGDDWVKTGFHHAECNDVEEFVPNAELVIPK
jgi:hypothetical protein